MLTRTRSPYIILLAFFALISNSLSAQVGATVPKSYVSLSINSRSHPWPNQPFGHLRLWDSGVRWSQINTSRGYINWAALDAWVSLAQSKGVELIYTFGSTPVWASTNKYQTGCAYGDGTCAPPNYTDWEEFVGQVATRYKGKIKYYEIWNEPNHSQYWTGSTSQMVELSRRAANLIRGIDSNARILSPSPTWASTTAWDWMNAYLNAGGGSYFDIVAFHAYTGNQKAETTFYIIDGIKKVLASHSISRPLWITEAGWGRNSVISDASTQTGFLAQRLLLTWSRGVSRYYWYQWDNLSWGTLWTSSGGTTQAGIAYGQVYRWLVGNKLSSLCSQNSTTYTWQCPITRADGVKTIAVWNATGSKSFPVPSGFTKYQDLAGVTRSISGSYVTVGWKPILLVGGTTTTTSGGSDTTTCDYSGMAQPSVKICTPTSGSMTSTNVHVVALAADSKAVASMTVYVDGTAKFTKTYSAKVDAYVTVSAGSHTIRVTAKNSGGTTYSASTTITAN